MPRVGFFQRVGLFPPRWVCMEGGQEHWPQRPTENSDPTRHAKGRTGDCPGPRKETTTRRNVT